jgi:hypothetical protein
MMNTQGLILYLMVSMLFFSIESKTLLSIELSGIK